MVTVPMVSAKLPTPGLLKKKRLFEIKVYDVISPDYDVTNKILLRRALNLYWAL